MFTFLQGQRYRLILFGGRRRSRSTTSPSTATTASGPTSTARLREGEGAGGRLPQGDRAADGAAHGRHRRPRPGGLEGPSARAPTPRTQSIRKTVELLGEMRIPLYVVLVGQLPGQEMRRTTPSSRPASSSTWCARRTAPPRRRSRSRWRPSSRTTVLLLKKFVYRVAPHEGLKKIEPVVRRIAAPPRAGTELRILSYVVLPLCVVAVRAARAAGALVPRPGRPRDPRAEPQPAGPRRRGQAAPREPTAAGRPRA